MSWVGGGCCLCHGWVTGVASAMIGGHGVTPMLFVCLKNVEQIITPSTYNSIPQDTETYPSIPQITERIPLQYHSNYTIIPLQHHTKKHNTESIYHSIPQKIENIPPRNVCWRTPPLLDEILLSHIK